jgi:hypothetical protein
VVDPAVAPSDTTSPLPYQRGGGLGTPGPGGSFYLAGGGGAGGYPGAGGTAGSGGAGGGGIGRSTPSASVHTGGSGIENTAGGGGGSYAYVGTDEGPGGNGGSGIVLIAYPS